MSNDVISAPQQNNHTAGSAYSVPAIHRTLDIIELLTQQRTLTVSEVGRQFGIPKSSAYAILQTLKSRGYVEKDALDRYSLSFRLFTLGATLVDSLDIRHEVHALLEELTDKARMTGHVAIREHNCAIYIDKVEILEALRLTTWIGKQMPLHSTSMGKALLAFLPEEEINRVLAEYPLTSFTPKTITDATALKEDLAKTRVQGYATCNEENEIGVRGVAAPLFNNSGKVVAAVNLGASKFHIRGKDMTQLGTLVRTYALKMSIQLGYRAPNRP